MADDQTGDDQAGDDSTTARGPTLAERRAGEQSERREQEVERQRVPDGERSRTKRPRLLVGAGITVGIVALVALGWAAARPDEQIEARCVDGDDVVVDDANCVTPASSTSSSYGGFFPIFIGAGGGQYHYTYGGSGTVGQRATGGTTVVPRDSVRVSTPSGRSVARGGIGLHETAGVVTDGGAASVPHLVPGS